MKMVIVTLFRDMAIGEMVLAVQRVVQLPSVSVVTFLPQDGQRIPIEEEDLSNGGEASKHDGRGLIQNLLVAGTTLGVAGLIVFAVVKIMRSRARSSLMEVDVPLQAIHCAGNHAAMRSNQSSFKRKSDSRQLEVIHTEITSGLIIDEQVSRNGIAWQSHSLNDRHMRLDLPPTPLKLTESAIQESIAVEESIAAATSVLLSESAASSPWEDGSSFHTQRSKDAWSCVSGQHSQHSHHTGIYSYPSGCTEPEASTAPPPRTFPSSEASAPICAGSSSSPQQCEVPRVPAPANSVCSEQEDADSRRSSVAGSLAAPSRGAEHGAAPKGGEPTPERGV